MSETVNDVGLMLLALIAAMALGYGLAHQSYDSFDQRNFPCQEDEVLSYGPAFGRDRVGCIHIDVLDR